MNKQLLSILQVNRGERAKRMSVYGLTSPSTHIGHFGDESFQSINCTRTITDNLTRTTKIQNKQKHKIIQKIKRGPS